MGSSQEGNGGFCDQVLIVGGTPNAHRDIIEFITDTCEDQGWKPEWIACPRYQLPSSLHLPNYLDGNWRIIVLHELRSNYRNKVLTKAENEGIPATQIEDYSPSRIREALEEIDRSVEEAPLGHVVAAKIVQKLKKKNRWGGQHSYLWWDDLPAGGFDAAQEQPFVHEVADILIRHDLLITKPKRGDKKVALNKERRSELETLADGTVKAPSLREDLSKIGY